MVNNRKRRDDQAKNNYENREQSIISGINSISTGKGFKNRTIDRRKDGVESKI